MTEGAFADVGGRPFGMYVHVPWCSSRCGYCDFNTYVPGAISGASPNTFLDDAIAEIRLARKALGDARLPVATVFFGGGTPTLLPPKDLIAILAAIDAEFGLADGAEVTTEANPESVNPRSLAELRAGGFNRLSLGMQSAVPSVLTTLDRVHTPGRALEVAGWARDAGFEQFSLDLIYGTPGETNDDWFRSLDAALSVNPPHVSAYSLIVEPGTRMARQVNSGDLSAPDDDDAMATRYEMADDAFSAAGLSWYEVSNWATPGSECRHNLGYWRNDDWWGIGPGAHSHVAGVRWWNVKHPVRYSQAVRSGESPEDGREELTADNELMEKVMLRIRLADGLPVDELPVGRRDVSDLVEQSLLDLSVLTEANRLRLTRRGRLLANQVIQQLLG